mgnify:CR=1 FL=1
MSTNAGVGRGPVYHQRRGFLAGVGAALAMTVAMVVLRFATGIPSLPEVIGEAFISLMPAAAFSAILEVLRTAAKPTLYVGIMVGTLVVGGLLGRGFAYGDLTWRRALALSAAIWAERARRSASNLAQAASSRAVEEAREA